MRIYFIGQKGIPTQYGGVERHVEELATRLAKQGNEVFVYCRNYYTPKTIKQFQGVKLIHLPTIKTKHFDAILHTFLASLDVLRRQADIIHYQGIGPSVLLWIPKLLKPKAKIISTYHCDDRQHQKWGGFAKWFLGLGGFVSVRWADNTIAVSKSLARSAGQEFKGQLEFIPNGVPLLNHVDAKIIKQKWGLSKDNYIVCVSRLIKHKGIQHLIRAYKKLQTDKKLVIVGDGNYTNSYVKELKNLAQDNPDIIFTGNQKGRILAELYSNAYIFVHPSELEGFSITLLEAMSYAKAIVCSDIEPNKEAVNGQALSFQSKNVDDLAEKINYLLNHPDEVNQMGANLKQRVQTKFNWDVISQQTQDLYQETLK